MSNTLKASISLLPSLIRLGRGAVAKGHRKTPAQALELYEGEYCPYCRYVREALTELDLDAKIYPVPKKGSRFSTVLMELGGKKTIPFLHDPNTGTKLYESQAIVDYLYKEYANDGMVAPHRMLQLSLYATLLRGTAGMFAKPSKAPAQPLELYSFEASPYARLVRETLCELELPYLLHNVGKGPGRLAEWAPPGTRKDYDPPTENRRKLKQRGGKMMVPYLVDPNTGVAMYQSADIQRYLVATYSA
ncbi:MAG: glutathione S-transferase N-terminal domain-containing protein [Rhodocyclaceae bacterium]|nr:glutathione S-transferase N-terminal domain-containing protein [Rhodocyclaceae bacterium]